MKPRYAVIVSDGTIGDTARLSIYASCGHQHLTVKAAVECQRRLRNVKRHRRMGYSESAVWYGSRVVQVDKRGRYVAPAPQD